MTPSKLDALKERRDQAQREVAVAQSHYRNSPRGGMMLGGGNGPVRIDPELRAERLDRGLAVDDAVIQLEQINHEIAEAHLAELTDSATQTALETTRDEAAEAAREAEAVATQARRTLAAANGALKDRQREAHRWQDEKARAEAAIRSAQSVRAKEQAQRDELAPFLPTPVPDRVVARAS